MGLILYTNHLVLCTLLTPFGYNYVHNLSSEILLNSYESSLALWAICIIMYVEHHHLGLHSGPLLTKGILYIKFYVLLDVNHVVLLKCSCNHNWILIIKQHASNLCLLQPQWSTIELRLNTAWRNILEYQ